MQSTTRVILVLMFLLGVTLLMMDCARRSAKHKHMHPASTVSSEPH